MVKIVDSRLLTVLSHLDVIRNSAHPTAEAAPVAPIEQSLLPVSLEPLPSSAPVTEEPLTVIPVDLVSIKQSLTQALTASSGEPFVPPPPTTSGEFLSLEEIQRIKNSSSSRMNFAAKLNRQLFSVEERKSCNVRGRQGKSMLDPERIKYVKEVTFRMYPVEEDETDWRAWSACVVAIDESNRRLNKIYKK